MGKIPKRKLRSLDPNILAYKYGEDGAGRMDKFCEKVILSGILKRESSFSSQKRSLGENKESWAKNVLERAHNVTERWSAQGQRSQESEQHNNKGIICFGTGLYNYSRQHVWEKKRRNPIIELIQWNWDIVKGQIQYTKQIYQLLSLITNSLKITNSCKCISWATKENSFIWSKIVICHFS